MTQKTNPSSDSTTTPGSSTGSTGLTGDIKHLASDVKDLAGGLAEQAKKKAEAQVATGKDRAVGGLESVADAIRYTGEHLGGRENPVAPYISQAADGIDRAGQYLRARTIGDLISDIEGFARREPAVFLGGAFALGLIGSRFLKSSAPVAPSVGTSNLLPTGPSAALQPPPNQRWGAAPQSPTPNQGSLSNQAYSGSQVWNSPSGGSVTGGGSKSSGTDIGSSSAQKPNQTSQMGRSADTSSNVADTQKGPSGQSTGSNQANRNNSSAKGGTANGSAGSLGGNGKA